MISYDLFLSEKNRGRRKSAKKIKTDEKMSRLEKGFIRKPRMKPGSKKYVTNHGVCILRVMLW
ncbi:MAG: hypothetical protein CSA32_04655 [Desulfobulbus propionicus]|nr:MAG: hypothetical protein CSA32_04655 [Desulfobulbus propionicus]